MNNFIWSLFLQTGNIEAYLLLKQIENEQVDVNETTDTENGSVQPLQTEM